MAFPAGESKLHWLLQNKGLGSHATSSLASSVFTRNHLMRHLSGTSWAAALATLPPYAEEMMELKLGCWLVRTILPTHPCYDGSCFKVAKMSVLA